MEKEKTFEDEELCLNKQKLMIKSFITKRTRRIFQ